MAITVVRKKSPRAPSMALDDAIERAIRIYDKETRHSVPVDVAAGHLGYKDAGNGAAMAALATLRYYALIERPKDGFLNVCKEVEAFKYAPKDETRRELVKAWLKNPPIFAELLDQYPGGLPSDGTIKYDLIQKGFNPGAADSCLSAFRRSVEFARFYEDATIAAEPMVEDVPSSDAPDQPVVVYQAPQTISTPTTMPGNAASAQIAQPRTNAGDHATEMDRIPVRLGGGRRAWIEVPSPLYKADKDRLIAQIGLLLTDDEEDADV